MVWDFALGSGIFDAPSSREKRRGSSLDEERATRLDKESAEADSAIMLETRSESSIAEVTDAMDGVGIKSKSPLMRSVKKPCACCHKFFADDEALEEHWTSTQHSAHDAVCAACGRHFPSYDTLRQHLVGKLPKESCAEAFKRHGCKACFEIFASEEEARAHACVFRDVAADEVEDDDDAPCVALDCEFVGVGEGGEENACARVCVVDSKGEVLLSTWVNPGVEVTDYRRDITGASRETLASAPSLDEVRGKVLGILLGKASTTRAKHAGVKHLLVGHSVDHDLESLKITWKKSRCRDTAQFPLYLRHTHLPFKLKTLAEEFLGEQIQGEGETHDPAVDARCAMRLYQAAKRRRDHSVAKAWFARTLASRPVALSADSTKDPNAGIELLHRAVSEHGAMTTDRFYCWCRDVGSLASCARSSSTSRSSSEDDGSPRTRQSARRSTAGGSAKTTPKRRAR